MPENNAQHTLPGFRAGYVDRRSKEIDNRLLIVRNRIAPTRRPTTTTSERTVVSLGLLQVSYGRQGKRRSSRHLNAVPGCTSAFSRGALHGVPFTIPLFRSLALPIASTVTQPARSYLFPEPCAEPWPGFERHPSHRTARYSYY